MNNNLQVFNNSEFGEIRTVIIDGEPWFVGKDVAVALGYANTKKTIADHVDEEDKLQGDGVTIRDPMGREQHPTVINESGLYSLILSSKLPSAKKFKRWVTSEVLPALRKTGTYSVTQQRELTKDDYIKAASMVSSCRNERLPYVLGFLEQAGFSIPKVEQVESHESEQSQGDVDMELLSRLMCESGLSLNKLSSITNICKASLSYYKRKMMKPSENRYMLLIQVLSN